MLETNQSVSSLVDALNEPSRTRIGNPWRGTFSVSIAVDIAYEAASLATELDLLGVTYQANFKRDEWGTPKMAFLAIYGLDDQCHILETLVEQLKTSRQRELEDLVAARGPIPPHIVQRLQKSLHWGRDYEYLAQRLNDLRIVGGMGSRGWTARKLKQKLAEATAAAEQAEDEGRRAA
jgi:hypothetical protein